VNDKKLSNPASLRSPSFLRAGGVFLRGLAPEHPGLQTTRRQSRTPASISQSVRWILICFVAITNFAGVALLSGCGQSEPQQQPSTHQQETKGAQETKGDQQLKDAAEKAWADALQAGTTAALNAYLANHGRGTHAAEARQRLTELEEQARRDAEEKAWADASRTRTAAAMTSYLQNFGSGNHALEARQRLSLLQRQERQQDEKRRARQASALGIPAIDVRKTCRLSGAVIGTVASQKDDNDSCIKSEQVARDDIVKQWAEFSRSERAQCMNAKVYLPSYVEWVTCLEMQRDVRRLRQQSPSLNAIGQGTRIRNRRGGEKAGSKNAVRSRITSVRRG
jgi:hypothetical protein